MGRSAKGKIIYAFIDTNLLFNERPSMNIFETRFLRNLIKLRDFFDDEIKETKISIVFPYTVIQERYSLKTRIFQEHFDKFLTIFKSFNNEPIFNQLSEIKKDISNIISKKGAAYLSENKIVATKQCNKDNFEKIIRKAYMKEIPFANEKKDGFKDALIWYSIFDYLKGSDLKEGDEFFLFTNNQSDFNSKISHEEFKKELSQDIHIIGFEHGALLTDVKYKEFLKYLLSEANNVIINEIDVDYSHSKEEIFVENVYARPFPSNLKSLIYTEKLENAKFKEQIQAQILNLLNNFDFKVKEDTIIKFKELPKIGEIIVLLRDYKNWYYDILSVEVDYENGDVEEIDLEEEVIFPLDAVKVSYYDFGYIFFGVEQYLLERVVQLLEKSLGRRIYPDIVNFSLEDTVPDTED